MKHLQKLFVFLMAVMLVIPFGVLAEEENAETTSVEETEKEPVKVYFFRGETCGYCKAALEWFDSIEEEYGKYYDIVSYEVWNDTDNQSLMQEVADVFGDEASGVPYIIVGHYTYPNGFGADSVIDEESGKTMGDEMIERIMEVYESDARFDVMQELTKEKPNYDNVVAVVAALAVAGLITVAVITRRSNKEA